MRIGFHSCHSHMRWEWHVAIVVMLLSATIMPAQGQSSGSPYVISSRIGSTIDTVERSYFNLFPDVVGFVSAQTTFESDSNVKVGIASVSVINGTRHDTSLVITVESARELGRFIEVDSWGTLRSVQAGESCVTCGSPLELFKAVEIGHIFKLGTKYSESMGGRILSRDGEEIPIVMGSYGIGIERVMASAVELFNDETGINWPVSIAPFHVVVTPVNVNDPTMMMAAEGLYGDLLARGVEALIDDRDERAGVKFKDADLIGVPYHLNVGRKAAEGIVELIDRSSRRSEEIPLADVVERIERRLAEQTTTVAV